MITLSQYIQKNYGEIGTIYLYYVGTDIYKIGKTENFTRRSKSYIGADLVYSNEDIFKFHDCEKHLIDLLSQNFKRHGRTREYFECDDRNKIKDLVVEFCNKHNKEHCILVDEIPSQDFLKYHTLYIETVFKPAFYKQKDEGFGNIFMSKEEIQEEKRKEQERVKYEKQMEKQRIEEEKKKKRQRIEEEKQRIYQLFIDELVVENEKAPLLSISELYFGFRDWYVESFPSNRNVPSKLEVKDYITKIFGEPINHVSWKGYELRDIYEDTYTESVLPI